MLKLEVSFEGPPGEGTTEAKREETKAKRVAQAIEMLAEGKSRNWKYESKA